MPLIHSRQPHLPELANVRENNCAWEYRGGKEVHGGTRGGKKGCGTSVWSAASTIPNIVTRLPALRLKGHGKRHEGTCNHPQHGG